MGPEPQQNFKSKRRPRAESARDLMRNWPWHARLREALRKPAIFLTSWLYRVPLDQEWVILLYYHCVLDEDRRSFAGHLKNLRQYGDWLSLDDAVTLLGSGQRIGGRYFCVTFDDGFRNCCTNAMPILLDEKCPAAFFLPTDYIDKSLDENWDEVSRFYHRATDYSMPLDFLSWDECRQMQAAGMTLGAHTASHVGAAEVSPACFLTEMQESKARIEQELGSPCKHFAAPFGGPSDFDAAIHPRQARQAGFSSFLTTLNRPAFAGTDPFLLPRVPQIAGNPGYCIRRNLAKTLMGAAA